MIDCETMNAKLDAARPARTVTSPCQLPLESWTAAAFSVPLKSRDARVFAIGELHLHATNPLTASRSDGCGT
jgi:hypothetical protein